MVKRWMAMEHYRMHVVEGWPESEHKQATLASIHAAIASLGGEFEECQDCRGSHPSR